MAPEQNGFKATMGMNECADRVLAILDRSTLKSLRLSCKQMDTLIASDRSCLFSRVYISAYQRDIDVLHAISSQPRLANAVRELVWDVSRRPDLYEPRSRPRLYESSQNLEKCNQIIRDCRDILERGHDFQTLLKILPKYPRLQGVTFTELMSHWITQFHSRYFQDSWTDFTTEVSPFISYTSPAMREWRALGADMGSPAFREMPAVDEPISDGESREMMLRLEDWAKSLISGTVTDPPKDVSQHVRCSYHGPLLLTVALRALGIQLRSYKINLPSGRFRHKTVSHRFQGLDFRLLELSCPLSAWFADMFQSLRYLRLCLNDSRSPGGLDIRPVLERASKLGMLELSTIRGNTLIDLAQVLPTCLALQRLTLYNFRVETQSLERILIPWGLANSLQTIRLVRCIFHRPSAMSEMEVFNWLLEKDISNANKGSMDPPHKDTDYLATAGNMGYTADKESDEYKDTGEEQAEQFMDVDWQSDTEDDMDYFPCTDEMWSRHLDAPFLVSEDENFAEEMARIYWEHYHIEGESEFEEGSDTQSIRNEVPMTRLRADEARVIPSAAYESVELVYSGRTWGCRGGMLNFLIDDFVTEESDGA